MLPNFEMAMAQVIKEHRKGQNAGVLVKLSDAVSRIVIYGSKIGFVVAKWEFASKQTGELV